MMELTKRTTKDTDLDGAGYKPQAVFEGGGFTYRVIKTYQNDDAKPYARWFLGTSSPHTYGTIELGDGYVRDVVLNADLVEVDGREPTEAELKKVRALRSKLRKQVDPMDAIFG